ncbi:MAG: SAM-dependent methyltransferase [Flavobacterium sp.]|nr:MAG: SAM-dependent methyltransferase [Flavobacterium sp.]
MNLNKEILTSEIQEFITNYNKDISKLAFAGSPFEKVTVQELIQQIESRNKIEKKLPTWFQTKNIFYPPKLNLEQTSSEITAKYKASIINGNTIADVTGGFGIDSYYFSEKFKNVQHFEINNYLSEIATYNFSVLQKKNIQCFKEDGLQQVQKNQYDVIYIDPSRRNDLKGKVFLLKDCLPNVPGHLDSVLFHCKQLLIKTSPMLDISLGLNELKYISEIHIVAVNNEVKELLWLAEKGFKNTPKIKTRNFNKTTIEKFDFNLGDESHTEYSEPLKYIYEPNASILKSGAFNLVSERYNVQKLHKNTHLFTSDELVDFPGRRFIINTTIPYSKKEIKIFLNMKKANITIRNFPESVSNIRKKLKISDGGDDYLFFTTTGTNIKIILVCSKV